ncbi:MAG: hypothetical protein ACREE0_08355 [Phenylobacterium sp.]
MLGRIALLCALLTAGPAGAADPYRAPRTSFGAPSLEGDWTNATFTALQRPKDFKSLSATPAEAAAFVHKRRNLLVGIEEPKKPDAAKPNESKKEAAPDVGDLQSEWYEIDGGGLLDIHGQLRTSIIIDPADGRLPYNAAGKKMAEAAEHADEHDFSNPEVRMPDERCLLALGGVTGPPMLASNYNAHYRIIQTPREIAIYSEMIHDVRVVRIGARHPAVPTHPWMGDSIGWWEGDTLVIETVDQNPGGAYRFLAGGVFYTSPAAKVTERLTRVSPTRIHYAFTVDDPGAFTRPWRGELAFHASKAAMYEYACHEGNYSLPNILAGGRAQEREAAAAKTAAN